jgi:hypothetical protein
MMILLWRKPGNALFGCLHLPSLPVLGGKGKEATPCMAAALHIVANMLGWNGEKGGGAGGA